MHNDTAKIRLNSEIYKFRYYQKNHTKFRPTKPQRFDYPKKTERKLTTNKNSNIAMW